MKAPDAYWLVERNALVRSPPTELQDRPPRRAECCHFGRCAAHDLPKSYGGKLPPPVRDFLLVQVPITLLASSAGVWLFYVQHQFEHTYWARGADPDIHTGALHGSSHYDLPPVLRWFTANIGSIIGGAVGGGDVGEIKRAPAWNARREQPRFIGLRRDWLIRDSSSGDDGERSRDLVVAARNGPGERIGLTGVRDGVAEHDRCGGADVAGVNKWKTIVSHRSCKSSLSPNGVCGA
jgi:hypothetical protein